jgi:hypothetical protein
VIAGASQEVSIDVANRPASRVNYNNKKPVGIELTEMRNNLKTGVVSQVSKEKETLLYMDKLFKIV